MTMNENQYRIWRSPYSRFGGLNSLRPDDTTDETVTAVDCYTDDVLREIAENGFNAIWLHSVLANITHLDIFPEFGKHAELHIRNLSPAPGVSLRQGAAGHLQGLRKAHDV